MVSIKKFNAATNGVWFRRPKINLEGIDNRYIEEYKDWEGKKCLRFNFEEYAKDHHELDCTIDYPLSTKCDFKIILPENKWRPGEYVFNTEDIVDQVCKKYHEIYREESETLSEIDKPNPHLINRGFSNGKWGIWGHDIGDLVLEEISLDTEKHRIDIEIGS